MSGSEKKPDCRCPARSAGPVRRLLDDERIQVAEMDPGLVTPEACLFPEELRVVERAIVERRQQFAAGRCLARRALEQLGLPPQRIASDAQRVPVWPAAVVGAISHTRGWCAAAVARSTDVGAIGIDVEAATPLEPSLWERICRPSERELLARQSPERAGLLGKGLFSAKESIYKALYPTARRFLDFQSMQIDLEAAAPELWRFHAELCVAWGPWSAGTRFGPGLVGFDARWIASAIALPPAGAQVSAPETGVSPSSGATAR